MNRMMRFFKLAMAAAVLLVLGGAAQAGIIILDDPFSPPDQVVVAAYGSCQVISPDLKLMPLLRPLQAGRDPGMAAAPHPAAPATPAPRAVRAMALVLGTGF